MYLSSNENVQFLIPSKNTNMCVNIEKFTNERQLDTAYRPHRNSTSLTDTVAVYNH